MAGFLQRLVPEAIYYHGSECVSMQKGFIKACGIRVLELESWRGCNGCVC
jgi:hypothetical protein